MKPKHILTTFNGHDEEIPTLEYAFDLGRKYGAHIEVWHVTDDDPSLLTPYGVINPYAIPEYFYSESIKIAKENKKMAREKYLNILQNIEKNSGLITNTNIPFSSYHEVTGRSGKILSIKNRISDLLVMNRPVDDSGQIETVVDVIEPGSHPVLLTPPVKNLKKFNDKILIAWNGSKEVARAVTFALPYLSTGKVWIAVSEKDKKNMPLSANDLVTYLQYHGITSEVIELTMDSNSTALSIENSARTLDAGMIVMGAYGHRLAREIFLGGVTEYMLSHSELPLFLAH